MHPNPIHALIAVFCIAIWIMPRANADGGRVIRSVELGELRATIMASPWPLQAGPADIGIFLQDKDRKPVLDAAVSVGWAAEKIGEEWIPPCCRMKPPGGSTSAVRGHGQNRLLYSADLTIPGSGPGSLRITVDHASRSETIDVPATADPPAPPALAYLPWLAMTPLAIGAYALHQSVRRRPPGK